MPLRTTRGSRRRPHAGVARVGENVVENDFVEGHVSGVRGGQPVFGLFPWINRSHGLISCEEVLVLRSLDFFDD